MNSPANFSSFTYFASQHSKLERQKAFTLLEILIALALVAILMAAALPYMHDALTRNQGDEIQDQITTLVEKTRGAALTTGNTQELNLSDIKIPKGWKLEEERMSDKKFHPIGPGELWNFNSEGISDPMTLRLIGPGTSLIMKFDPITGQIIQDEE